MTDFKPGLEGVVAFQTEIAEPDREGGALRYRGVDIEELVGSYHYEQVWGLLVDGSFEPGMPDPEPYEPAALTGNAPSDLQAETARLSSVWGLRKLVDIDDDQAHDDLARLSAQMMSIVARSAAVHDGREPAPDDVVAQGETAAEKLLLRWRGEADPEHVTALDTYWICTAEHGLNASTFTARITASTGADCGAAMSGAVGALSGPLHGGAPARVLPMLDEVEASGDPDAYVRDLLDKHGRIMGFGHRVYRAEDPRSRVLKRTAKELGSPRYEVAEALEEAALAALRERKPDYVIATNVEFYSAVVLDLADVPPDLTPAMFACSRVAGWSAHILEEKRTGRLIRPSAEYVGPGESVRLIRQRRRSHPELTLADAAAEGASLAEAGAEQQLAGLRSEWGEELEAAARAQDYRERVVAYRAIGQLRFRQKTELLRRGLEDESPACRGSALMSLELLSRDHPGLINDVRPLLQELSTHDDNQAVRRLAVLCLRNGSPQRETILLLNSLAEDDEQDRELRATAKKVAEILRKRDAAKR